MDRFKFRAWHEGFIDKNIEPQMLFDERIGDCLTFKRNQPVTLMQCTGLKDKNGKLIFEGDVVAGCNGSINGGEWGFEPYVIKWENKEAAFNVPLWGVEGNCDSTHWFEIIGNIHQNPELLESL